MEIRCSSSLVGVRFIFGLTSFNYCTNAWGRFTILDRDSFLYRVVHSSCRYTLSRFLAASRQVPRGLGSFLVAADTAAAAVRIRTAAAADLEDCREEAVVAKSHTAVDSFRC